MLNCFCRMALMYLVLAASAAIVVADEPAERDSGENSPLQKAVESIRSEHSVPGMVYGYLKDGQLNELTALGVRKKGHSAKLTVNDKMHLGSCTKAMTAVMLATLVEEGKLEWSTTLADVFTEDVETIHPDYRDVTVDMLLRHRGGLPANVIWQLLKGDTATDKRRSLISEVLSKAPARKPGTTYLYSNLGYALAGLIGETITGEAWEELMRQRVFKPLKMTSAGFGIPGKKGTVDQPWGHYTLFFRLTADQRDNPRPLGPAGTVHCSLNDWSKFARIFTRSGRRDNPVLKAESIEHLLKPRPNEDYAGGWVIDKRSWSANPICIHSGSNTRWFCTVVVVPGEDIALLVATNSGTPDADRACHATIDALRKHAGLGE